MKEYCKIIFIYLVIVVASVSVSFFWLDSVVLAKDQISLYKTIQDISTFLFGVMGIWIGIVHPDSLKDIFQVRREKPSNLKDLKAIFFPIRNATLLLIVVLSVQWLYPVLKGSNWIKDNLEFSLRMSFSFITFSIATLIWSLVRTLVPLNSSQNLVENAEATRESSRRLTRGR